VSVLLRQAHGFESLLERCIGRDLHDPIVLESQGMSLAKIGHHTAAASTRTKSDDDGRTVVTLHDPLDLNLDPLPRCAKVLPKLAHAVVCTIDRREVGKGAAGPKHDLRIERLQEPFQIGFAPGLVVSANQVFLRHRPRSIPQVQESA
jgi:hypothetical protein